MYFALSDRLSVYYGYWTTKRDALYTYTVTVYSARLTKRGLALYTFMIVCEFRVYDSKARRYAEDITEQNRIVRTGKFEVEVTNNKNKKLSCRRETARRLVSLNILLRHSRSLMVIRNDTVE